MGIWGAQNEGALVLNALLQRFYSPGTWLTLLAILALTWGLIRYYVCPVRPETELDELVQASPQEAITNRAEPFVLLLVLLGAGLVVFPEFFYLRDQFGYRMNTIFKFYFQAWILWAMAAAYASVVLLRELRGVKAVIFLAAWLVLVSISLPYTVFGVWSRTGGFQPGEWTLDGADYLARYSPDEMDAIRWLQEAPYGVVAEAIGGSYTGFARVSTLSGLPTVLGWPGHEVQWRGGAQEMGSRQPDIEQLYRARDWEQASEVLEKYNIRYVFFGSLEQSEYNSNEALFKKYLEPVFQNNSVTIYEVPRFILQQGQAPEK
jgi:uncharacterized membrane protein